MFRIWKRFFGEERAAFLKARSTLPGRLSAALSDLEGHWRLLSTVVQRHLTASLRNLALRNPQSGQRRAGHGLHGRAELLRVARRPPRRQRQCQRDAAGQAPRGVCGGHERDGTDGPIRELRFDVTRICTNGHRNGCRRRDVDPQRRPMGPRGQNRGPLSKCPAGTDVRVKQIILLGT